MKRIGILTLYYANNMGALLQAFSLQQKLTELGYESEFIKVKDFEAKHRNINDYYSENSRRDYLKIAKELYNNSNLKYDAIIVGSDEIWNIKNDSFEHLDEFLGYNLNTDRIIAYAPSANGITKEYFENYYNNEKDFSKFTSISARDVDTKKLIEDVSGKETQLVVDPTFLIESFDKYIKEPEIDIKDYVLVYGYEFSKEEENEILSFAKRKGKKVYSLSHNMDWCETFNGDIFQLLGYLKRAEFVITNTFHGTLFSINLEKEFALFTDGKSKVIDIVERYGLHDRDYDDIKNFDKIFDQKVDYKKINKLKADNRDKSLKYLVEAIEG